MEGEAEAAELLRLVTFSGPELDSFNEDSGYRSFGIWMFEKAGSVDGVLLLNFESLKLPVVV